MPQVLGGEIGKVQEDLWTCAPCKDAGLKYKAPLAKVLLCCATKHDAWETEQDEEKKIVSIKSRTTDQ